jgi:hypothetical protein
MRAWVFGLFGFMSLALICAMQRVAIYGLQQENTKIRKLAVDGLLREADNYNKQAMYVVNATHSLPEPEETADSADVTRRIDMLIEHLRLESSALPSLEWTSSVLLAARQKIVLLQYNEYHNKTRGFSLGSCTR